MRHIIFFLNWSDISPYVPLYLLVLKTERTYIIHPTLSVHPLLSVLLLNVHILRCSTHDSRQVESKVPIWNQANYVVESAYLEFQSDITFFWNERGYSETAVRGVGGKTVSPNIFQL